MRASPCGWGMEIHSYNTYGAMRFEYQQAYFSSFCADFSRFPESRDGVLACLTQLRRFQPQLVWVENEISDPDAFSVVQ